MRDDKAGHEGKDPEFLSTLERGLRVMNAFGRHRPEMLLSEVAAAAGLSPAVARRCLNTLAQLGYVRQDGRRFLLLPKMLSFGNSFLSATNLQQAVSPTLQNLWSETGDSIAMGVPCDDDVICITYIPSVRAIRPDGNFGTSFPLHATSMGKAILAFLPDAEFDLYLRRSRREAFTGATKTADAVLKSEIRQIRKAGYARSDGEYDKGVYALAVPVFDAHRNTIGAINCSTARTRDLPGDYDSERVPLLKEAANQIERDLRNFPVLGRALGARSG